MVASIASATGMAREPGASASERALLHWTPLPRTHTPWQRLAWSPPCGRTDDKLALPCSDAEEPELGRALTEREIPSESALPPPGSRTGLQKTLGGFMNLDVMRGRHVSAGPQVSWLTPESPREDLLRLRVVAPGWAVRYTLEDGAISVGVAASTRFVMLGEEWPLVDVLTSEARFEFLIP
jgi:hypothetical protein